MKSYIIEPNHERQEAVIEVCELHGTSGADMMAAIRYALQCEEVEVFYGRGALERHAIYVDQDALLKQLPSEGFMYVPAIMEVPFAGRAVVLGITSQGDDDVMVEPHIAEESLSELVSVSYVTKRYAETAFSLAESKEKKAREYLDEVGNGPVASDTLPNVFDDDSVHALRWVRTDARASVPSYISEGAACFDLAALEDTVIPAGGVQTVRLGLAVAVPQGSVIRLFSRKDMGLDHTPRLCNGCELVDSTMRDELVLVLANDRECDVLIKADSLIARGLVQEVRQYLMVEVDHLPTPIDL